MYARVYESFIILPLVSVVNLSSRLTSSRLALDGPPSATPTKTSSAAAPPLAPARQHNRPKPTQIQIHKDTIPTRIDTGTCPRRRTIPIRMPTTRTRIHSSSSMRRNTAAIQAERQPSIRTPSLCPSYQPGIPAPAPAPDRPTNAQVAMSRQEKPGQQWRRSASPAPSPPHSHALLQSGSPALSLAIGGGEWLEDAWDGVLPHGLVFSRTQDVDERLSSLRGEARHAVPCLGGGRSVTGDVIATADAMSGTCGWWGAVLAAASYLDMTSECAGCTMRCLAAKARTCASQDVYVRPFVLSPRYARDELPHSLDTEHRELNRPAASMDIMVLGRSVVRCPLYEMAMGSGGTMTMLSIAVSQW
ncbi:hypothetical protein B0H13DRAFT_2553875 [Mycena leptocephala]|nr:hypothetical protein B0H13DRAFT_2553875 [Mycena leptocephala]